MKKLFTILLATFLLSCSATEEQGTFVVMKYSDFGPPIIATELLGQEWWSWQNHGDSRPRQYAVQVVVFKGISLEIIESKFPIIPEKEQDYRYITYQQTMTYLEQHIEENVMPTVTEKLIASRDKLKAEFDK